VAEIDIDARARRVESLLSDDRYAALLGIGLVSVDDASIVLRMEVGQQLANFTGSTHGGAVFSLADCALSLASNVAGLAVAVDTHLAVTAPSAPGDTLEATVVEEAAGNRLATYRVTVRRGDGRICGVFTGTVFRPG
jgi:acyl-CoA thioesterase